MVAGFQFHRRVRPLVLELVRAEADERDELRAQLVAEIEADDDLSRSAVVVGGRDGILLSHSRGRFDADRVTRIASASKLLTSIGTLRMLADRNVSLDTPVHRFISWWTDDAATDARANVTLRHTLAFTTGFASNETDCIEYDTRSSLSIEECVRKIYNTAKHVPPGTVYDYGSAHMAITGLAMQKLFDGEQWVPLFDRFVTDAVRAELDQVDAPLAWTVHSTRPMLAGGVSTNANVYAAVLRLALFDRDFLAQESLDELFVDQTANVSEYLRSPARDALGFNLHYSLGAWLEASNEDGSELDGVISSTGAFGFYPALSQNDEYFLIVSQNVGEEIAGGIIAAVVLALLVCICCVGIGIALYIRRQRRMNA